MEVCVFRMQFNLDKIFVSGAWAKMSLNELKEPKWARKNLNEPKSI